ncbi:hypothetical protein C8R46DRAFT_1346984 [Mycena filopes]|nr:hypothetical protein C8R46DRAFT_1346984 [Mycena filopes]
MPKAKPATALAKEQTLLIISNGDKSAFIPRPKNHKAAIDAARRHFPAIRADDMVLQTNDLEMCNGKLIDIPSESWELIVDLLTTVSVIERHECPEKDKIVVLSKATVAKPRLVSSPDKLMLHCGLYDENVGSGTVSFGVKSSTTFARIVRHLAEKLGLDGEDDFRLLHQGQRIDPAATPQSLGLEDEDTLDVFMAQGGDEPRSRAARWAHAVRSITR